MNTQIVIVTLLITIAVITTAYEFDDPIYNQILANEYQELEASVYDQPLIHPRVRRDEEAANGEKCRPPHFGKKKLCCAEESFEALQNKMKDDKKACFHSILDKGKEGKKHHFGFDPFNCTQMENHKRNMVCVSQCVGKSQHVLGGNGEPIEDEVRSQLKDVMAQESWFDSLLDAVVDKCMDEAKEASAKYQVTADPKSCNPAGAKLMHCLFKEVQFSCPPEEIKDQRFCNNLRDRMTREKDFNYGPGPHHFHHREMERPPPRN